MNKNEVKIFHFMAYIYTPETTPEACCIFPERKKDISRK